jgi:hypothetical protein
LSFFNWRFKLKRIGHLITWWEQFIILYKRTFRERCRDYFDKLRLVQALGVAVLLGLLWWKSKTGTEAQLRDQVN